ncbi:60S ribosomal protein L12 [Babesia caballi]|uniref:60S ribosomal protein L12 n=1 Tax=Babesia caballi TaxID=5871 RepID=A0AAV4LXN5_BABCB|nr:60S ribosomal protein L12 [Babesia caballi]
MFHEWTVPLGLVQQALYKGPCRGEVPLRDVPVDPACALDDTALCEVASESHPHWWIWSTLKMTGFCDKAKCSLATRSAIWSLMPWRIGEASAVAATNVEVTHGDEPFDERCQVVGGCVILRGNGTLKERLYNQQHPAQLHTFNSHCAKSYLLQETQRHLDDQRRAQNAVQRDGLARASQTALLEDLQVLYVRPEEDAAVGGEHVRRLSCEHAHAERVEAHIQIVVAARGWYLRLRGPTRRRRCRAAARRWPCRRQGSPRRALPARTPPEGRWRPGGDMRRHGAAGGTHLLDERVRKKREHAGHALLNEVVDVAVALLQARGVLQRLDGRGGVERLDAGQVLADEPGHVLDEDAYHVADLHSGKRRALVDPAGIGEGRLAPARTKRARRTGVLPVEARGDLDLAAVYLLLKNAGLLVVDGAADGEAGAEDLLDGAGEGLGHGVLAHGAGDGHQLLPRQVAAVLDVLHFFPVAQGLLQLLDQQRRGGGLDLDLGLPVLDGQLDGDLDALPVGRLLGDVVAHLLGRHTEGTELGGEDGGGRDLTAELAEVHCGGVTARWALTYRRRSDSDRASSPFL